MFLLSQQSSVNELVRTDFHSLTRHCCSFPICLSVSACGHYFAWLCGHWDWIHCVHAYMLVCVCVCVCVCACVCVDVCYLKLVSFWLLPNHNTGIVAQPVTHTNTHAHTHKTCWWTKHGNTLLCTHGHWHTHVHTQLYALGHRQACPVLHLPTHICLMWKLLLCHITGNEPVHMSPVSFKVRELHKQRARELHCSITVARSRLCYFFYFLN